jgi:hypothetical protein
VGDARLIHWYFSCRSLVLVAEMRTAAYRILQKRSIQVSAEDECKPATQPVGQAVKIRT